MTTLKGVGRCWKNSGLYANGIQTAVCGDGTENTACPCFEWRNWEKRWQTGETSSLKNGALQNFLLTKTLIEIEQCEKVLERLLYGVLKENVCGWRFQCTSQTHYNYLPLKAKYFWCALKILEWQKHFLQYGILQCAVVEVYCHSTKTEILLEKLCAMAIYWSHWKIQKLSAPFFCILDWVAGILWVFDWELTA